MKLMNTIARRTFLGAGAGSFTLAALPLAGCSGSEPMPSVANADGLMAVDINGAQFKTIADTHTLVITDTQGREKRVGGLGTAAGQLNYPTGVATLNGFAYVVETGNHRVQVFDATGRSVGFIGQGELLYPQGIAIAGSEIFVADSRNGRIVSFTPAGEVLRKLGVGVLSAPRGLAVLDNSLLVADPGLRKVLRMGFDGQVLAQYESDWVLPVDVATDGQLVFVADVSRPEVAVLSLGGQTVQTIPVKKAPTSVKLLRTELQVT